MPILLYKFDNWTLNANLQRRSQAFESKCYRRMLGISYREPETNDCVWQQVNILAGRREPLLSTINRRNLSWFGHVWRHDTLLKIVLTRTVYGNRRRGRLRKSWRDNIKKWTNQSLSSMFRIADVRSRWATIAAEASVQYSNDVVS